MKTMQRALQTRQPPLAHFLIRWPLVPLIPASPPAHWARVGSRRNFSNGLVTVAHARAGILRSIDCNTLSQLKISAEQATLIIF